MEVDRRVNAFIAEVKARGEPILPGDFEEKPIPDDENAAIPLKQAEGILPRWSGRKLITNSGPIEPYTLAD